MELATAPVYKADRTSQFCNGLQALLMTTGQAVRRGTQQRHLQLRGSPALWTAAGMDMGGPSQLVVPWLHQSHGWTLQMQLN